MKIDPMFEHLLRKLDPDDAAVELALLRAERLARILSNDSDLGVLVTRVGGSCAKRTAINPVKDVDLFVYLDEAAWRRRRDGSLLQPHTVLRSFLQRLETTFRKPIQDGDVSLRRQDHSIGVRYLKEGSVAIDVVPALWAERNKAEIVRIPERSSGEWRETCVARQILLLEKYDAPNRYLRRGIRLLKYWRNRHRIPLPSYALELLCIHEAVKADSKHPRAIFLGVQERIAKTGLEEAIRINDYVRVADNKPPRDAQIAILDPAVAGNNVASELGAGDRRTLVAVSRFALERLHAAEYHLAHGHVRDAGVAFRAAFSRERRVRNGRVPKMSADTRNAGTRISPSPSVSPETKRSWWSRLWSDGS